MKLVAGLGNPGREYEGTRHNVGFDVLDCLARRHGLGWPRRLDDAAGTSLETRWRRASGHVILLKPLTFMNLSGFAVREALRFYKIEACDLLIVTDDVNLPLGRLRARASGSEGGHNGLRSIAEQLGTADYARLRVGVGRGDARRDLADHVLARFDPEERPAIEPAMARAADAVEAWVSEGLDRMMNVYNREEQ